MNFTKIFCIFTREKINKTGARTKWVSIYLSILSALLSEYSD